MLPKETTCDCCEKDFSYGYEDLKSYETIYGGELTAVEYVFCPHCGAEVITEHLTTASTRYDEENEGE